MRKWVHLFFAILMSILFILDCWELTTMVIIHWYDILITVFSLFIAFFSWLDLFKEDE